MTVGDFDIFDTPQKPAPAGGNFSEFDQPVGVAPAEEKRSFLGEVGHRIAAPFVQAAEDVKGLSLPSSMGDAAARVKQNIPLVGKYLAQPFKDMGHQVAAANDFAARAITSPVQTFGDGKAGAVVREGMRGVNANIPFANLAVERMGGPVEASAEDAAKAPGAQEFGSFAGTPLAGAEAALATRGVEGAASLASKAADRVPKLMREIPKAAAAKADEWLIKDIRGQMKGESTPTARKYLAADEEDVLATTNRHPELKKTLQDARHSDRKHLEAASDAVEKKIAEVNEPRADLYDKDIDGALGGGIRSGDFVKQLRDVAEEHRANGTPGGHKMAKYLEARADELEQSRAWGYKQAPKLEGEAAVQARDLNRARENLAKRPGTEGTVAKIDEQLKALEDSAPKVAKYDPDTIVPSRTVRQWVTDLQDVAYDGLGGLADTRAAGQARIIARDAADAFNVHLDRAAATVPDAVEKLRDINTQHSALKNIQRVIDERLNRSIQNAEGAGGHIPHTLKQVGSKLVGHGPLGASGIALASGHPMFAAALAVPTVAAEASRFASSGLAGLAKSPRYRLMVQKVARAARSAKSRADFVKSAINGGIPSEKAAMIWDAAHGNGRGETSPGPRTMADDDVPGLREPGNIDIMHRPVVKNADGTTSTVRSMSFEEDGNEVLVPTVADDGSRILSDDEAIAQYKRTGKFLGKFSTPEAATAYAKRLHEQQERDRAGATS